MEIPCVFELYSLNNENCFSCFITKQLIPENQEIKLIGEYEDGKTNNDIIFVSFYDCEITKVPQGLTKMFPNLKILWITRSKLKNISKNDLAEYKELTAFLFNFNEIEYLPGDLFEGFQNLEEIDFYKNKLKVIEPNILDGHEKLRYVDFRANSNYDIHFSIPPNNETYKTLEDVKFELFEKCQEKREFLENLKKSASNFQTENRQLKEENVKIKADLEDEKLKNLELTRNLQSGFFGDIKALTQDEATKNFQIQIGDQAFSVHKFILEARSPTLAEILKNNPEVENLNLVDISVEIFEKILKFLYTDELPDDADTNYLLVFAAAAKLKIEDLKNFAAQKLTNYIDENNVLEVLKISNKYDHDELRLKSFDKIKEMYPKCDFKDDWSKAYEFVIKIIDKYKKYEEAFRKMEEDFYGANLEK